MKYPAVLPFIDVLPQLAAFDAIIDVRSPSEFAEDHIPGAINCPVLNDAERAEVGTVYRQVDAFEAKKLGAAMVAKNIAFHLETRFLQMPRDWRPLVYCWRGGNRSGAMAHILAKIGWPATQIEGGYKQYRACVRTALDDLPAGRSFRVICGPTGSGKSRLLQALAERGAQVLDLEQLAEHRGSVLGNLATPQPSQKMFESRIWQQLSRFDPVQAVFIESESKKVGNLRVPDALIQRARQSPCISLTLPHAERVELLLQDYAHFIAEPKLLNTQLECLIYLHGREKIRHWQQLALSGSMQDVVEQLLQSHYDPAYLQSIKRNFTHFADAQTLALADCAAHSFAQAAEYLHQQANESHFNAAPAGADQYMTNQLENGIQ